MSALIALHRLPEGGRVLEREALLAERIAEAHPRAFLAAGGAAVAFIDQHEIVPLEGIDGDGLVAHLVLELVDVEDLDRLPGEQPLPVLLEQLGRRFQPPRTRAGAAGSGPRSA